MADPSKLQGLCLSTQALLRLHLALFLPCLKIKCSLVDDELWGN